MNHWLCGLNAPTGAWCSLTQTEGHPKVGAFLSQCTYRCVVLPDVSYYIRVPYQGPSQCTYRCVVLPDATAPSE